MVYCTHCGAQNPDGARFCNGCGAPLSAAAVPPPAPGAPPQQWVPRRRGEEECLGQSRVPGIIVFALIILLVGVFTLIQWIVERSYGTAWTGLIWPFFGIAVALLIIGVWALSRMPQIR